MARGAETELRILDAAYALFWRQGFVRVSMDEIAQRAKLTKRTLYQHFRSKDELMASALARSSDLALARLEAFRLPGGSEAMIDSLFSQLAEWASKPRWSGAGFTRVVVELADLRGHPARAIARRHKTLVEVWLASRLGKAGVASSRERAREVTLLMEGAMMLMLIHGDLTYAKSAADAAKLLVRKKRDVPGPPPLAKTNATK
jgi:AcrR family transcriptional regulator